ncbi:hypothetical protein NYL07_12600 [Xanthomonas translucens pv. translucens]|uniref:hypothetical protein n=1 Tax=Xanthomonas campestris pv. translucens TaxID=343 RepID=UPI000762553B|nr:hypothetical protein [Xanthomonas translucens]KWV17081.1 hypothetical protein ATB54_00145 [Xanthomonas translucens]MCS3360668.1 hypothetical protein [Xanthomonas translucens pv. translucens]MCS3373300.1 hypothetical protein [Xanthomonas translucens pv. translucens]MCT8290245.1 hypothetical protein [Xanthomonas translucens pv. translucens]MCT8293927.1 hypothetical protein [Xanthomonas translucens pv. translucens]
MNLDQYKAIQPRIAELQRTALEFAELGQAKVSRLLLTACLAAQRIKPTKLVTVDPATDAGTAPKKGKGA